MLAEFMVLRRLVTDGLDGGGIDDFGGGLAFPGATLCDPLRFTGTEAALEPPEAASTSSEEALIDPGVSSGVGGGDTGPNGEALAFFAPGLVGPLPFAVVVTGSDSLRVLTESLLRRVLREFCRVAGLSSS